MLLHGISLEAFADLSLIVIDLKYNERQGVKICEIQPGSFSRFSGADILQGENALPNQYCDLLAQYGVKGYFTYPIYSKMRKALVEHGWVSAHSIEEIDKKLTKKTVTDPDSLQDYQCFLFSSQAELISRGEPYRFPHILFLDRAILPYSLDKYTMNCFLNQVGEMKKLRPVWRLYRKGVSQELIERIYTEIPGDIVVVKPVQSTMGRGVIIVEKKNLEEILKYVFYSPKEVLLNDLERSYSHYAVDISDFFIVEEFIASDPLDLGSPPQSYDCTMRVMALLTYNQKKAEVTFLSEYWYSPKESLEASCTLIQSHKAKGTHVASVSKETVARVRGQLTPALLKMYELMLSASH